MKLNVINPRKRTSKRKATKRKATKRRATKRKTTKRKATKRKATKRKATKRRSTARSAPKGKKMAKKKRTRRKRRTTASPRRRTRRRARTSNPSARSMMQVMLPYSAGSLLVGLVAEQVGRKMGRGALVGGMVKDSPSMGLSWSPAQYIAAGAAAWFGPMLLARVVKRDTAALMGGGMLSMIFQKLVYTELVPELPGEAKNVFGGVERVAYDEHGQAWMKDGDGWQAMQGAVVEATPLDGAVVEATPLDGTDYLSNYANREFNVADAYKRAYQQGGYY